jgi:hypothetical protein
MFTKFLLTFSLWFVCKQIRTDSKIRKKREEVLTERSDIERNLNSVLKIKNGNT